MRIDQQIHGYQNGHKLLSSSVSLDKRDQELINRLSDVSGPLGPGETFDPYLTGYPLPSGRFVFARTWLDLNARRAGCVLTRSLIVDSNDWTVVAPASLLHLLTPPTLDHVASVQVTPGSVAEPLPVVQIAGAQALIEALFLERQQPIVCFGDAQGEVVALRVVQSLWPGRRQSFSFCTLSLQPRSIEGRPFDLLFAPKQARSRYSDWPGRKLDLNSNDVRARHVWTAELEDSILRAPAPTLSELDPLGLLRRDRTGSSSSLRLTMLWRDLEQESLRDPSATLGLLDVLSASGADEEITQAKFAQVAGRAYSQILASPPSIQSRALFLLLLGKMMPGFSNRELCEKASAIATRDVVEEPDFAPELYHYLDPSPLGSALAQGVADGFVHTRERRLAFNVIEGTPDGVLQRLVTLSAPLFGLITDPELVEESWIKKLARLLSTLPDASREHVINQAIPFIRADVHSPLIGAVFAGAAADRAKRILDTISNNGGAMMLRSIQRELRRSLLPEHRMIVRDVIASRPDTPDLDDLLASTLDTSVEDFGWVVNSNEITERRRLQLLTSIIESSSDKSIASYSKTEFFAQAFEILSSRKDDGSLQCSARMLIARPDLGLSNVSNTLKLVDKLKDRAAQDLARKFIYYTLDPNRRTQRIDIEEVLLNKRVISTLSTFSRRQMIDLFYPQHLAPSSWMQHQGILKIVVDLPRRHPAREALLSASDLFSEYFASSQAARLDADAIEVWTSLIRGALDEGNSSSGSAAATALNFVLRNPTPAAAKLAFASFPIVLWHADQPRNAIEAGAKVVGFELGETKVLRQKITDTYLRARWPIDDLIVGAWAAHAAEKVATELARTKKGVDLLTSALEALPARDDLTKKSEKQIKDIVYSALSTIGRHRR